MDISDTMNPEKFHSQHWTHCSVAGGKELLSLSGIVDIGLEGESEDYWKEEVVNITTGVLVRVVPDGKPCRSTGCPIDYPQCNLQSGPIDSRRVCGQ